MSGVFPLAEQPQPATFGTQDPTHSLGLEVSSDIPPEIKESPVDPRSVGDMPSSLRPYSVIHHAFWRFNYKLYLALFVRMAIPTVYQTFRVSILGALPDTNQLNIASQMVWVNVLLEIIEER